MRQLSMQILPTNMKRAAGFTLLELLIASAIGSFLIAGVFTVFSNGRETQATIEVQTQLVDDGRFAIHLLTYELRHAGLWGQTNDDTRIAGAIGVADRVTRNGNPVMPALPGDCEPGWYRNLSESFFVADNVNPYTASGCIPNGDYKLNTDVLVIKHAATAAIQDADLSPGVIYVYANHFDGELFSGTTKPTWGEDDLQPPLNYRLNSRAYFVNEYTDYPGDSRPSLRRVQLEVGPSLSNTMMIPGVEDFQIQLGLDTDNSGSVNMYVDASNPVLGTSITGNPSMAGVQSVQFWVMIRSQEKELIPGETQTISIGGNPAVTYTDRYRRVVVSKVVRLQNREQLTTAAGG